jgi:hypothetical protein
MSSPDHGSIQIDPKPCVSHNTAMSAEAVSTAEHELEDAISRLLAGVRDPEVGRKAREDMDRMREETRKRTGTVEVAAELVRDARDQ